MVELLIGIGMGFGIVLVGGIMALDGGLEWGVLVAFALWIQRFFDPIRQLTMQYSQLQRSMASGVRIFEVLDLKSEVTDVEGAPDMPPVRGHIKFEGVGFHYVPGIDVLKDVNLDIKPGENVALVGSTGAGKTTLSDPDSPVRRCHRGPDHGGWIRHSRSRPPLTGIADEHGASRTLSLLRDGEGEYPL